MGSACALSKSFNIISLEIKEEDLVIIQPPFRQDEINVIVLLLYRQDPTAFEKIYQCPE